MNYVIIDLEWNGSYVKKVHGYFNEIIEIGAVKLDSTLRECDRFQAIIRPAVSKKLTELVTNLTSITDEELTDGGTFTGAMAALKRFIGREETTVLTWSTTDLLVLLENYRYFCKTDTIPFMHAYVDLQAYYQQRMQLPNTQQVGLAAACEQLSVSDEDVAHHRALDDSILTGRVLQRIYDADSFAETAAPTDETFYRRITFKNRYVTDRNDPSVKAEYLSFSCPQCGRRLTTDGKWRGFNRALCANMHCAPCDKRFTARVQIKEKFDATEVKRKLLPRKEETESAENVG